MLILRLFRLGNYIKAAWKYIEALVVLTPYHPLELFMPAWEGQLSGLSTMCVASAASD